jgi:hypothetical protein
VPIVQDGSQPIQIFGSSLVGTRYGTPGLLALFAEVTGTDTCRSAGVFACFVLIQTGLGLTLLARVLRVGPILSICSGLFGVIAGWSPEILKIGSWDHLLFLSFLPFALLRIRLSAFRTCRTPEYWDLDFASVLLSIPIPKGLRCVALFTCRSLFGDC